MFDRRGFLRRLLAFLALPFPATRPAAARTADVLVLDGWVLTERDLGEIARLDR